MAMIKLAQPITDIEGKFGGDIFRTDQCGPHVQAYPRLVDHTPTKNQQRRHNAFKYLMAYIRKFSTYEFVIAWQTWSNKFPRKTKKGKVYTMTWHQAFISFNLNPILGGAPVELWPPD